MVSALDRVEIRAGSFPKFVEHEFIRPFGSFMNDASDEFGLLRTTIKNALYLDEHGFSLTRFDMVMETQCRCCSFCHSVPLQMFVP